MGLARGRHQRMPAEDSPLLPPRSREFFQSLAEIKLLGGIEFVAEPAQFTKRAVFAKNERAGRPALEPADRVPDGNENPGPAHRAVHPHQRAAADATAAANGRGEVLKQFPARELFEDL